MPKDNELKNRVDFGPGMVPKGKKSAKSEALKKKVAGPDRKAKNFAKNTRVSQEERTIMRMENGR